MSDLSLQVEEMLRDGSSVDEIVDTLGIPLDWVLEVRKWMDFMETAE
jgi:hypothetical protein